MLIIGLTGIKGAGKDSVADYLVKHYGFERRAFADPIKQMLLTLNPYIEDGIRLSYAYNDGGEKVLKEHFPEYRRLMQVFGTECIRYVDEDFWVRLAMNSLHREQSKYVFTDVRFPNEAQAIKCVNEDPRNRAFLWNVQRPGRLPDGHSSEAFAGDLGEDNIVLNNGSMSNLHAQVEWALQQNRKEASYVS